MAITAEKLRVEVEGDTSDAKSALGDLEQTGKGIPNWVGGAKTALMGLFGVGAGAGILFSTGLASSMDGANATAKVKAQLGLTQPESAKIGKVAGSMFSDNYGDSMEDVGGAVAAVVSSVDGMRSAQAPILEAASKDVMAFAETFDQDVPRVAQVAGQAVKQGLAGDFNEAMDLMTAASQKVPVAVQGDLIDAIDEYGGFFSSLGLEGDAAFSILAKSAEKGMFGIDKTGDALKELTIRATDGSKTTVDAYKSMGVSASDMAADILAGGDRAAGGFGKIVDGLLGIKDPQEQANAAIALFGAPLEDLGVAEIPQFLSSLKGMEGGLGDTAGAAKQMGEDLYSGPGTALAGLKRSISTAFMGFTDTAIPAITSFANTVSAQVAPTVQNLGTAIGGAINWAKQMVGVIRENSTLFGVIAGVIAAVFIPGLVAMGVAATVAKVKVVAAWIAQKVAAVGSVAAQSLAMVKVVAGWVRMAAAAVVSGAQTVAIWAMYQAAAIRGAAASALAMARVVAGWVLMGVQATVNAAKVVAGWVLAGAAAVAQGAVMAASMAATAARVVAGWVLMGVQSMAQAARMAAAWFIALGPIGWITAAVIAIVALVIANWDKVRAFTVKAWGVVASFVSAVWKNIVSFVTNGVNKVKSFVQSGMKAVQAKWDATWSAISGVAKAVWNAITSVVTGAIRNVKAGVTAGVNAVKSVWTSVMNAVRSVASSIWNAVVSVIRGAISNALAAVNRVRQVIATIRNAFTSAKSAAQGVLNGLVGFVRGIPGKLVGIFTSAVGTFRRAGSAIIGGLVSGLKNAFGGAVNAVKNGLSRVRNLLPFSPAKEGPFSGKGWTLYSGQSIATALGDGIRDKMGVAQDAARDMVRGVSKDMALPDVTAGALSGASRPNGRSLSADAIGLGEGRQGGRQTVFVFNTHNPLPEAQSTTTNKALARVAGLGW